MKKWNLSATAFPHCGVTCFHLFAQNPRKLYHIVSHILPFNIMNEKCCLNSTFCAKFEKSCRPISFKSIAVDSPNTCISLSCFMVTQKCWAESQFTLKDQFIFQVHFSKIWLCQQTKNKEKNPIFFWGMAFKGALVLPEEKNLSAKPLGKWLKQINNLSLLRLRLTVHYHSTHMTS